MNRSLRITRLLSLAALVAALSATAVEAQAQDAPSLDAPPLFRSTQIEAYLVTGFGGQVTAEQGGFSGDADLDPTVGLGARLDLPLSSHVTLGPIAEFHSYKLDGASGRDTAVDAGIVLRAGHLFDVNGMTLDLYGALPAGFTAYFPDDSLDSDTYVGFNVGLLGGGQLFFTERVGVMVEMGWQLHSVYNDGSSLTANQFRMNVGAAIRL